MRIGGLDNGRFDKPTHALVAFSSHDDLGVGSLFGIIDIRLALVERSLVDNGVDKVHRVFDITHLDFSAHPLDVL